MLRFNIFVFTETQQRKAKRWEAMPRVEIGEDNAGDVTEGDASYISTRSKILQFETKLEYFDSLFERCFELRKEGISNVLPLRPSPSATPAPISSPQRQDLGNGKIFI